MPRSGFDPTTPCMLVLYLTAGAKLAIENENEITRCMFDVVVMTNCSGM